MDVNEYYRLMGNHPESDSFEMPVYNHTPNGKPTPILGPARKPVTTSGLFKPTVYNDPSGKPRINNDKTAASPDSTSVYRPGTLPKKGTQIPNLGSVRGNIYMGSNFILEVPGRLFSGFTRVSGLEGEWEFESVEEGGYNGVRNFPKHIRYPHLVCEYGVSDSDGLFTWHRSTVSGMIIRLPILLMMLDGQKKPVNMWAIEDAFPAKYVGPQFDALSSQVAVSRVEFIYSDIMKIPVSI
jgi:phage tail-like protein